MKKWMKKINYDEFIRERVRFRVSPGAWIIKKINSLSEAKLVSLVLVIFIFIASFAASFGANEVQIVDEENVRSFIYYNNGYITGYVILTLYTMIWSFWHIIRMDRKRKPQGDIGGK